MCNVCSVLYAGMLQYTCTIQARPIVNNEHKKKKALNPSKKRWERNEKKSKNKNAERKR